MLHRHRMLYRQLKSKNKGEDISLDNAPMGFRTCLSDGAAKA